MQLLVNAGADIDSQDNRKVSCLMAAFRKGHVKVVKWMVKHVTQFPGDPECIRYINTINDKVELNKHNQDVSILCILSAHYHRVATAQGKQGIWLLIFPDRENTGNLVNLIFYTGKIVATQGKF